MDLNQISVIVNIILGIVTLLLTLLNIYQFFEKKAEVKTREFLLTDWHNTFEGLRNALYQIVQNPRSFSGKDDVISSVNVVTQIVGSMTQAMEEQRFFSPKQALQNRQEKQQKFEEQMQVLKEKMTQSKL